jgi:Tfp pilus assembly protein PilZ
LTRLKVIKVKGESGKVKGIKVKVQKGESVKEKVGRVKGIGVKVQKGESVKEKTDNKLLCKKYNNPSLMYSWNF